MEAIVKNFNSDIERPADWLANARECALENIWDAMQDFIENPN